MIQTLFILNSSGTIVLRKDYRDHTSRSVVDFFWNEVCRAPSPVDVSPVLTAPRNYLFHVYRGGLFYMAPVAGEVAPILVLEMLHRIADTFKLYFGPEDATENKLRKNFAICFQLLEEVRRCCHPPLWWWWWWCMTCRRSPCCWCAGPDLVPSGGGLVFFLKLKKTSEKKTSARHNFCLPKRHPWPDTLLVFLLC